MRQKAAKIYSYLEFRQIFDLIFPFLLTKRLERTQYVAGFHQFLHSNPKNQFTKGHVVALESNFHFEILKIPEIQSFYGDILPEVLSFGLGPQQL